MREAGIIRAHALQARVMAEPDLHAPLGVYDGTPHGSPGKSPPETPTPPSRSPSDHSHPRHQAGGHPPRSARRPRQPVAGHRTIRSITPHDDLVETTGRRLILGAGMPTMLIVDMDRSDAAGLDLVRRAATRESTFQGSVSECIRQAQATAPGYDPAPDEGPTGLWPAANMFPDPAVLPGAMPMETPDRPGPAQDAGMDGPAIGA